jgi:CheY-like chemotaxis protein
MDEATRARAFEPFFTTKGERGTGLGLATVFGIVQQAGGHLAVDTAVDRGTTVRVYLPRAADPPAAGAGPADPGELPRGTETVLVAEDEDGVRTLTRHVLSDCGYTVLEARDGADAVRVAAGHPGRIDLLVTDVVMPRAGGREAADRLRAARPGLKVLYVSGHTDDAVIRHGVREAEVAFLQKPFSPHGLAAKVRAVLDGG